MSEPRCTEWVAHAGCDYGELTLPPNCGPGCPGYTVPQLAPEPVTAERAGNDEARLHIPTLRKIAHRYREEFDEFGVPFARMVDEIEKEREKLDDAEREIIRRIDTTVRQDIQGKRLRKEYETTHLENIQLRAELAELDRLGVAAGLARIASGEAEE